MSPDLAETVKRLRELAGKATPGPWCATECCDVWVQHGFTDESMGVGVAKCGDMSWRNSENVINDEAQMKANGLYIAAANPAAISSILDALEGLDKRERAYVFLVGKIIKALGEHEDDDLSLDENVAKLVASLAEARKGARTPCPNCGAGMAGRADIHAADCPLAPQMFQAAEKEGA